MPYFLVLVSHVGTSQAYACAYACGYRTSGKQALVCNSHGIHPGSTNHLKNSPRNKNKEYFAHSTENIMEM